MFDPAVRELWWGETPPYANFTRRAPDRISADHTGAPEALSGTAAAAALVEAMVADARKGGFRIVPLYSYVTARHARNPGWADAFVPAPGERADP
nr:N-acetyltransferase [Paracoccus shandongensis]